MAKKVIRPVPRREHTRVTPNGGTTRVSASVQMREVNAPDPQSLQKPSRPQGVPASDERGVAAVQDLHQRMLQKHVVEDAKEDREGFLAWAQGCAVGGDEESIEDRRRAVRYAVSKVGEEHLRKLLSSGRLPERLEASILSLQTEAALYKEEVAADVQRRQDEAVGLRLAGSGVSTSAYLSGDSTLGEGAYIADEASALQESVVVDATLSGKATVIRSTIRGGAVVEDSALVVEGIVEGGRVSGNATVGVMPEAASSSACPSALRWVDGDGDYVPLALRTRVFDGRRAPNSDKAMRKAGYVLGSWEGKPLREWGASVWKNVESAEATPIEAVWAAVCSRGSSAGTSYSYSLGAKLVNSVVEGDASVVGGEAVGSFFTDEATAQGVAVSRSRFGGRSQIRGGSVTDGVVGGGARVEESHLTFVECSEDAHIVGSTVEHARIGGSALIYGGRVSNVVLERGMLRDADVRKPKDVEVGVKDGCVYTRYRGQVGEGDRSGFKRVVSVRGWKHTKQWFDADRGVWRSEDIPESEFEEARRLGLRTGNPQGT